MASVSDSSLGEGEFVSGFDSSSSLGEGESVLDSVSGSSLGEGESVSVGGSGPLLGEEGFVSGCDSKSGRSQGTSSVASVNSGGYSCSPPSASAAAEVGKYGKRESSERDCGSEARLDCRFVPLQQPSEQPEDSNSHLGTPCGSGSSGERVRLTWDEVKGLSEDELQAHFGPGTVFEKLPPLESDSVPSEAVLEMKRVLLFYRHLYRDDGSPSTVRGFSARVDVKPGTTPVQGRVYRHGPEVEKHLRKWVEEMEAAGNIEPSTAPWRSGVICIPKSKGGIRTCTDLRKVNKTLMPVSWVTPIIQDLLDDVRGSRFISLMDLKSAFHQIPISPVEHRAPTD